MATVAEMIAEVRDEAGIDESDDVIRKWVLNRIQRMIVAAGWKRAKVTLGPTVAGQSEYDVPDNVTDLRTVWVNRREFILATPEEMIRLQQGLASVDGADGAMAPEYGATGAEKFEIFPSPASSGDEILGLCELRPADPADGAGPDMPEEFHHYPVKGAIADGLAKVDERFDEAAVYEAEYQQGIQLLRARRNSRIGSGPVRFRVPQY